MYNLVRKVNQQIFVKLLKHILLTIIKVSKFLF